jgi:hypothetical protein
MTDKVIYFDEISLPCSVPAGTTLEMSRPKETIDIGYEPMTDTAKPTPGPWYFCCYPTGNGGFVYAGGPGGPSICDLSEHELPEQNGNFIAETGTVYHETNLTPRQLLEQRNQLIELLEEFMLSDMDHPLFDDAHKLISDIKNGEQK